ncbi:MAG: gamma-glutamyltransferase [Candidatus Rokubacteria bacterium]|nr:gamma-glutamyltransferase [Candidatus Rokubacteria bacterium]
MALDAAGRGPFETASARGVVASPHVLASEAGRDILAAGGNALDAAIAAAATIAVVYPHMNGVGGDNFWLIHDATGQLIGLNAAGRSAAAVDADVYRARFGDRIPPRGGAAALTVPGAVSGWWEAHQHSRRRLGSPITWPALLERAIHHAGEGFPVSAGQRRTTAAAHDLFGEGTPSEVRRSLWPLYHPTALAAPSFRQRELAGTLAILAAGGAGEFYRGALGRRTVAAAQSAGSPLRMEDFSAHTADWVEPLRVRYRRGEAVSLPPPTQGFAALAILALLEGFDVAALSEADYVHVVVEATKLALDDRDRWLTDPTAVPVPVDRCLDRRRLDERRGRISLATAQPAAGTHAASGDTIAIVAADAAGNAVSVIQSLYHEFGSGVVAGETGVLLQNRGAFFSLDPGHPNHLAPRKRTAHTLIPSMYLVGGRPRLVYGTMGGDGQPQTQAALVTRMVDRGLRPGPAVASPRWLFGRTWGDTSKAVRLEGRFGRDLAESLTGRGHEVQVVEDWSDLMGHAHLIEIGPDDLVGASDPRADGAAIGQA